MIEYQRDVPADDADAIKAETEHVRAHLAAAADVDDNPATRAEDVIVWMARHPDDPTLVRIEGRIEADPAAPYLADNYDPWAGVDHELFAAEIAAAERDQELLK